MKSDLETHQFGQTSLRSYQLKEKRIVEEAFLLYLFLHFHPMYIQ